MKVRGQAVELWLRDLRGSAQLSPPPSVAILQELDHDIVELHEGRIARSARRAAARRPSSPGHRSFAD